VTARNETTGPYYLGDEAVVAVSAQYYAGGPLPNAETTWNVSARRPTTRRPTGPTLSLASGRRGGGAVYDDFTYGMVTGDFQSSGRQPRMPARTDATGNHYLQMTFIEAEEPRPYSVVAEGRVMDVNRQAWAAATTCWCTRPSSTSGCAADATFVRAGRRDRRRI
jgi:hypothetical protein